MLDDTQSIAPKHLQNFKYFLGLVPTIYIDQINFFKHYLNTMQYAVTEYSHDVNLEGSITDSLPGIFFVFGIEPITLTITARKQTTAQFLIRISGIIGGFFVVLGILLKLSQWISELFHGRVSTKKQF
jgi:succinate dehydrogenase hydrophobic anchor subunit